MSKFKVGFTYKSNGEIEVEAASQAEAEKKVQLLLDEFGFPTSDDITWESGEGEVW